jgi:hypothetical protein
VNVAVFSRGLSSLQLSGIEVPSLLHAKSTLYFLVHKLQMSLGPLTVEEQMPFKLFRVEKTARKPPALQKPCVCMPRRTATNRDSFGPFVSSKGERNMTLIFHQPSNGVSMTTAGLRAGLAGLCWM